MATNWRDYWLPIYVEVHQHLRESAKKRDQIIAFYLVLLAALSERARRLSEQVIGRGVTPGRRRNG